MENMDTNQGIGMTKGRSDLYCGPLSIEPQTILGGACKDNIRSWFTNVRVYYVHTARTAIRRSCELLGIKEGDEVLAPSYNCGTEIDALLASGASVYLYDVDLSGKIDFQDISRRISKKTRAIYVTHYFGFPQKLDVVKKLCNEKGIYLIEDCALALLSCDGTTQIGSVGDIAVFNFPKFLPVPDGGVLCINNSNLAVEKWNLRPPQRDEIIGEVLPLLKRAVLRGAAGVPLVYPLLWWLLKKSRRHPQPESNVSQADIPDYYYYDERLTDRAIARISEKIAKKTSITDVVKKRRANFRHYLTLLANAKNIRPLFEHLPTGVNPLHFPILIEDWAALCKSLNELSIAAVAWWAGYHRQLHWQDYPNACYLKDHLVALPVHQQLRQEHIQYISERVVELHDNKNNEKERMMTKSL